MEKSEQKTDSFKENGIVYFYGYKLDFEKERKYPRFNINQRKHYEIIRTTFLEGFLRMRSALGYLSMYSLYRVFEKYKLLVKTIKKGVEVFVVDKIKIRGWLEDNRIIDRGIYV